MLEQEFDAANLPVSERKFSRRRFGQFVGAGAISGAVASKNISETIAATAEQWDAWEDADCPNDEFLKNNESDLKNVIKGCSFAPEYFGIDSSVFDYQNDSRYKLALECLRVIVEEWGIKDIRLGLRWDTTSPDGQVIDLAFYRPFWKYCLEHDVSITSNVGPIKVFRWPEQHVPDPILNLLSRMPSHGERIASGDEISIAGQHYLERLAIELKKEYKSIPTLQPSNEPFNQFGILGWMMSWKYLKETIGIMHREFPQAKILLNSAGYNNLDEIARFFKCLTEGGVDELAEGGSFKADPTLKGLLVSGYNYYYKYPGPTDIPVFGLMDTITRGRILDGNPVEKNRLAAARIGFDVETSEVEMEKNGRFTSPGNSVRELRFAILRCARSILIREKPSVLRLWGDEGLAARQVLDRMSVQQIKDNWKVDGSAFKKMWGEFSDEHRQMIDLIQKMAA